MHLGLFLLAAGHHAAGWRFPGAESGTENFELITRMAREAEAAKFDMVFFGDRLVTSKDAHPSMITRPDPLVVLSALAVQTRRIGLAATASTTYSDPFTLARSLASIDLLSQGRAAWNIVTTVQDGSGNFSRTLHPESSERYTIAEEFVQVVKGLWRSWDADPYVRDKEAGVYIDAAKLHELNHAGHYFQVKGPLNVTRSSQGEPVLIQAGSSGPGQKLGARHGEVIFTAQQDLAAAREFYGQLKRQVGEAGRDPSQVKVMPGLMPIVARTAAEARDKLATLQSFTDQSKAHHMLSVELDFDLSGADLDAPVPDLPLGDGGFSRRGLLLRIAKEQRLTLRELYHHVASSRGHQVVTGTAEQIADHMQHWVDAGAADGFNIMPACFPSGFEEFAREVVPILQERGQFRRDYAASTLRGHLGLAQPV
ncbi:LLM class flavin-dependent oxidoreductase [Diaphorobacter caeni]|uniref:LLM class flavin-dependent oxidoreductase n=1 Tax=Diaphorobacter caeni TaxID=2784387 RepID=UPI00188F6CBC|nr:LLM class flavin-dependent oxidoreductase [Diaphorobacter caeni]MBF5002694.1 LLM class flavin-dependent oxidoreductase [Diaphorobacter caeni]